MMGKPKKLEGSKNPSDQRVARDESPQDDEVRLKELFNKAL
jgi:hypothetical protein